MAALGRTEQRACLKRTDGASDNAVMLLHIDQAMLVEIESI